MLLAADRAESAKEVCCLCVLVAVEGAEVEPEGLSPELADRGLPAARLADKQHRLLVPEAALDEGEEAPHALGPHDLADPGHRLGGRRGHVGREAGGAVDVAVGVDL